MTVKQIAILVLVLIVAFAMRVYFVPAPGYERDIYHYKTWSQTAVEYGVHNIYDKTPCDYPAAYLYVLKAIGSFYKIFYPKFDEHTYLFDFLIKLPAILGDLIASLAVFWFLRKKKSYWISLAVMAAYAFNPVIILNSTYWGQTDSVSTLIALGSILALINDKYILAWILLTLGILTKVQIAMLLPILILITLKRSGFKTLLNGMAASWGTYVFVLLPFLRFHKVDSMLGWIFASVGEFPFLSLFAFNFWWLFSRGQGRYAPDTSLFLNLFSYRTLGMMLLGIFFIFLLRYLFYREKDENAIFLGCAMAFFAYFMLPTEMHERYIYPVLIFLLLAAVKERKLWAVYGALSLTTFFSFLYVLFTVYPYNYPLFPPVINALPTGIIISIVNVMSFLFVAHELVRDIKIKYFAYSLAAILIMLSGLYFLKLTHPVYLSDLKPKEYEQQWGKLRINRTVDNNQLNINGFICPKGIGTHANSSIKYLINGRFRYLEGMFGMDDETNRGNKIEFMIYADDRLIFKSGILQGYQNPHYFFLPIKGVKEINLVVADGGDGINFDHADWLRVKVLP